MAKHSSHSKWWKNESLKQEVDAVAHYERGRSHHRRGDLPAAIASYRTAVALQPGCFEFHFNLAAALFHAGRSTEAAGSYREAVSLRPDDADAHYSLGVALHKIGDRERAAQAYAKALSLRPEFPDALSNLGLLCAERGEFNAAEGFLQRAIALDPAHTNAHCNLANLLTQKGDLAGALEACRTALRLAPDHALALCNYGALCVDMGEMETAEQCLRRSIALDAGVVAAHCNLANVLAKKGDTAGAVLCSASALALDPTHELTLCNLGVLLDTMGDAASAVECYRLALAAHPASMAARFYLSIQQLAAGDFAGGWQGYEARWGTREFRNTRPAHLPPQWRGEEIRGARILIYSEQGLGDTIQFVRYASMVSARGATVVLKVQPALVRLLQGFDPSFTVVSTDSEEGMDVDWQCPLMSLPLAFGTELATIPAEVPYLRADPAAVHTWRQRLSGPGLRVGLVWAGNPKHNRDRQRSIALRQFAPLMLLRGVTFYSLQKGAGAEDLAGTTLPVVDLSRYLEDFTDTAAIVANLDLVLCVDTAVAHLAAAMGRPVWMLIAMVNDWRWLKDRADTPWYPTMRLYRQRAIGQWDGVLGQVERDLRAMLDAPTGSARAATETSTAAR